MTAHFLQSCQSVHTKFTANLIKLSYLTIINYRYIFKLIIDKYKHVLNILQAGKFKDTNMILMFPFNLLRLIRFLQLQT